VYISTRTSLEMCYDISSLQKPFTRISGTPLSSLHTLATRLHKKCFLVGTR